jgi:hypothetical protein
VRAPVADRVPVVVELRDAKPVAIEIEPAGDGPGRRSSSTRAGPEEVADLLVQDRRSAGERRDPAVEARRPRSQNDKPLGVLGPDAALG